MERRRRRLVIHKHWEWDRCQILILNGWLQCLGRASHLVRGCTGYLLVGSVIPAGVAFCAYWFRCTRLTICLLCSSDVGFGTTQLIPLLPPFSLSLLLKLMMVLSEINTFKFFQFPSLNRYPVHHKKTKSNFSPLRARDGGSGKLS